MTAVISINLDRKLFTYNYDKTVVMIFRPSKKAESLLNSFKVNNCRLKFVNEKLYLGSIISNDKREVLDIKKCMNSFNRKFGFLFRKFCTVDINVLFTLYNSICVSFYGAELWVNIKKLRFYV